MDNPDVQCPICWGHTMESIVPVNHDTTSVDHCELCGTIVVGKDHAIVPKLAVRDVYERRRKENEARFPELKRDN